MRLQVRWDEKPLWVWMKAWWGDLDVEKLVCDVAVVRIKEVLLVRLRRHHARVAGSPGSRSLHRV